MEAVDKTTKDAQPRFGFVMPGVANYDTLTSTVGSACCRTLVGHTTSKAQHIFNSFRFTFIRPHANAASSGTQGGIVNSDDGFESECLLLAEEDVLVVMSFQQIENVTIQLIHSYYLKT